jgi:hypothetical protein
MIIQFKDRQEKILKSENCRVSGRIITKTQTYSTDFIFRWLDFGFIKIIEK